jgi:hypothetical protein
MLLPGKHDFAASSHDSFDANSLVMVTLRQATSNLRKDSIGVGTDQSDCAYNNDEDHSQHYGILSDVLACIVCPEADAPGNH